MTNFQGIFDDFQNELAFIKRNKYSQVLSQISGEISKLGPGNFDSAIRVIIKKHGEYIDYVGEKAVELLIQYLKIYKASEISDETIKKIVDYLSQNLKSISSSARNNAETYAASKGASSYLNLDVIWIGKELELKIPDIIGRLKIEVKKYIIENTKFSGIRNKSISELFLKRIEFIENKLESVCPDVLNQFNVACDRIREGNIEEYSQALATCRRILKSLADAVYPATDEKTIGDNGEQVLLNEDKYINRLIEFVKENSKQTEGKLILIDIEDLHKKFKKINDLASKGTHSKIDKDSAELCLTQTWNLIGEIIKLRIDNN